MGIRDTGYGKSGKTKTTSTINTTSQIMPKRKIMVVTKVHKLLRATCLIYLILLCSCPLFTIITTVSALDGTTTKSNNEHYTMEGKRVFVAIPSYDAQKKLVYLDDMIDAFRDLCHTGAQITIQLYVTEALTVEQINILNAKTMRNNKKCYHEKGAIQIKIKIKPKSVGFHLVDYHRVDFYKNIEHYDLFIYTEDDHLILPSHVIGYLFHTEKLKNIVPEKDFSQYSIGFLRYERDLSTATKFTFDQFRYPNAGLHTFTDDIILKGRYVGNRRMPYQGMYMATPHQLKLWRYKCDFDIVKEPRDFLEKRVNENIVYQEHREYIASLQLFANEGVPIDNCNVTQIFPINDFQIFLLHHIPDKYYINPKFEKENSMSPLDLQRFVSRWILPQDDEDKKETSGDLDVEYKGMRMEISQEDLDEMKLNDKEQLADVQAGMKKYEEYVKNKGILDVL